MLPLCLYVLLSTVPGQQPAGKPDAQAPLEKSAYLAFVDRDFIFTLEVVKPGVPVFNFVSMIEEERNLQAKDVVLSLGNRKVPAKFFLVDTGDPKEQMILASLPIHPRSAFGVSLRGEFGAAKEFFGVSVRMGEDLFQLEPVSSFDFENLALKVNKINLGSPDFQDDWRVLKLETIGRRERVRKR
jgi:hypothetical protein